MDNKTIIIDSKILTSLTLRYTCRFTQNLSTFRRDVVNLPKSTTYSAGM